LICASRNEAVNGPEKKGYEREEILPEEIDGGRSEIRRERERERERERKREMFE